MGYNIIKTVKKETERIKKKEKNIEHSLPIRIRNISYCFRTRCHIAGVNPRRPAHCRRKTASPRGELRRNRSTPGIGGNSPENAAQSAARSDAGAFADFASQWSSSWNPAKAPRAAAGRFARAQNTSHRSLERQVFLLPRNGNHGNDMGKTIIRLSGTIISCSRRS